MTAIQALLDESGGLLDKSLDRLLPKPMDTEAPLLEAMRYATLDGGKRLRPVLVLSSARLFGVSEACALRVAAAVECVHCYSRVHDDLPALDDDRLRRGKPTTHVRFGEATAILAGDALLTLAFEILAGPDTHADPLVRCNLSTALAKAAGGRGMVGGQMIEMLAGQHGLDLGTVTRLQRMKTGELFAFACESGAILGRADSARQHALHAYAHDLGRAFEITDDLLDVDGRVDGAGGGSGRPDGGPATFVSILGADRARDQAAILVDQAIRHLEIFGDRADDLRAIARYAVDRRS